MHRSGSAHQGIDCACVSGRRGIFVSCCDRGLAALAPAPDSVGISVIFADRCSLAHSGGTTKYRRSARSRILLVLFRQRTFLAISGEAVSAGLQQTPLGALLVAALGVAVSVEFVSAGGDPNHH